MRVAIDARGVSTEHRGVGRIVMNLLLGLSQRPSDLEYVVFHSDPYLPQTMKRIGGAYKGRFHWVRARSAVGSVTEKAEIPWLVRLHHIDLFHDMWSTGLRLGGGTRSVATIHELEFLHFKDSANREKRIRKVLRRSALVIALSEAIAGELEEKLHISRPKIRVVPGGIHPRFFERVSEDEMRTMRNRFGLNGGYYLNVSGNRQSKNLDILPDIFIRARERDANAAPLVMALDWQDIEHAAKNTEAWRKARDIGAIRFIGTVEDIWLRLLYAAADALIVPSLYEGFSLAAVEALACSCVPALSNIPAHHSIWSDTQGIDALFFNPADSKDLESALDRIRSGGAPLRFAVLEKFKEICHRYAVTEVADQIQSVYRQAGETRS